MKRLQIHRDPVDIDQVLKWVIAVAIVLLIVCATTLVMAIRSTWIEE